MTIDVFFSPAGLTKDEIAGRTVFVVDVLRATTTICAALANGARSVIPVGSVEEALKRSQDLGPSETLLAGERQCRPIEGFSLGNSPREMTETAIRGRNLIMTTTNGTRAVLASSGAGAVYLAATANLTLAGEQARSSLAIGTGMVVLCAGHDNRFGLDDAYVAGRLIMESLGSRPSRRGLSDSALAAVDLARRYGTDGLRAFRLSAAGQQLSALNMDEDVADAAVPDRYPVLPRLIDRRIVLSS